MNHGIGGVSSVYFFGVMPNWRENARVKPSWELKPLSRAASITFSPVSRKALAAFVRRRARIASNGVLSVSSLKIRAAWNLL